MGSEIIVSSKLYNSIFLMMNMFFLILTGNKTPQWITLYLLNHNHNTYRFSATWVSTMMDKLFISVSPPPPYGPANWTTNGSTTSLNLRNDTIYNLTISTCPYGMFTSHFIIGKKKLMNNMHSRIIKNCIGKQKKRLKN